MFYCFPRQSSWRPYLVCLPLHFCRWAVSCAMVADSSPSHSRSRTFEAHCTQAQVLAGLWKHSSLGTASTTFTTLWQRVGLCHPRWCLFTVPLSFGRGRNPAEAASPKGRISFSKLLPRKTKNREHGWQGKGRSFSFPHLSIENKGTIIRRALPGAGSIYILFISRGLCPVALNLLWSTCTGCSLATEKTPKILWHLALINCHHLAWYYRHRHFKYEHCALSLWKLLVYCTFLMDACSVRVKTGNKVMESTASGDVHVCGLVSRSLRLRQHSYMCAVVASLVVTLLWIVQDCL